MPETEFDAQLQYQGLWIFVPSPEIILASLAAVIFAQRCPSLKWPFAGLEILRIPEMELEVH